VALVPELALADCPPGVQLTALPARRRTLIASRAGATGHPAVAACAAALRVAAAGYPLVAGPADSAGYSAAAAAP
jgi:hypothetical protein